MSAASEISEAGQVVHDQSTAKKVNSLLNSIKTRPEGVELLKSYLPQCSDDDFIKYCISWMQHCSKMDGFIKNRDCGIKLLGTLFQISSSYPELKKSVSFFIATRYFDYVQKYFSNSEIGWACTKICISLYRGACGPFQEMLEQQLRNEVRKNEKISPTIASCFALLPSLGGGGNENHIYSMNWKTQFRKFINICHLILDNLFLDVEELQEYEACKDSSWTIKENEKNPEYLTVQLFNLCSILNHMLLCQYPTPKAIPSDLIFQLICRGLAVNPKTLKKQATTEVIALLKMLPEIHVILLSLLKAVIVTCKNQLLPYAYLVCKLLRTSLEWTESNCSHKGEQSFAQVRISAYEALCNWLTATRSGGCVDTISSIVTANATADISPKKDIVVLKESKQKQYTREKQSQRVNHKANDKLCFAAIKALQFLLKFVGVLLKPEEHKFLQEFTVKLLVEVQKTSTSDLFGPFSELKCRKELYSLLLELVQNPCSKWPPPTHFALRLFRKGVTDECLQVSLLCSSALSVTVNLIHSQYNNEGFPSGEATEPQMQWTKKPAAVGAQVHCNESENHEETSENDVAEKISNLDESLSSFEEDLVSTAPFVRNAAKTGDLEKFIEKPDEHPRLKGSEISPEIEDESFEKEMSTPGKDDTTPVKEMSTPEKGKTTPVNEMSTPGKKMTTPVKEMFTPGKEKTILVEEMSTPEKEKTTLVEEMSTPEKDDTTPVNEMSTPGKEKTTPVKEMSTPGKEKTTPVKEMSTPGKEKTTPVKEMSTHEKEKTTPEKKQQTKFGKESKISEDSGSLKSLPEVNEEIKPKKTYFLRSKIKASSEEPEEAASLDNLKNTPLKGLTKATPRKSRKRALSKGEFEWQSESKMKKNEDDEESIIAVFDDTIIE